MNKHAKHDSMQNINNKEYFNIQEHDNSILNLAEGEVSPFNDMNDEFK
jgi:hypothetical protein